MKPVTLNQGKNNLKKIAKKHKIMVSILCSFIVISIIFLFNVEPLYAQLNAVPILNKFVKNGISSILFFQTSWLGYYIPIGIAFLIILIIALFISWSKLDKAKIKYNGQYIVLFILLDAGINIVALFCTLLLGLNMFVAAHGQKMFKQLYNQPYYSYLEAEQSRRDKNKEQITKYAQNQEFSLQDIINMVEENDHFIDDLSDEEYILFSDLISYLVLQEDEFNDLTQHYFRNYMDKSPNTLDDMVNIILNPSKNIFGWRLVPLTSTLYHMNGENGEFNLKFISLNGHFEVVYNKKGEKLTVESNPDNMGTYNYADPVTELGKHAKYDVQPYLKWGNIPNQGTISNDITKQAKEKYDNNELAQNHRQKYEQLLNMKP